METKATRDNSSNAKRREVSVMRLVFWLKIQSGDSKYNPLEKAVLKRQRMSAAIGYLMEVVRVGLTQ